VGIDDNDSLADVTPTVLITWTGTESPTQICNYVVVGSKPLPSQNFGLFNGTRLTSRVFADNGVGSGLPNDGMQNGTEMGLASVVVKLTDSLGTTTYDNTTTDGAGNYLLWLPNALSGKSLHVVVTNPVGSLATGANVGTTGSSSSSSGGTYSRPADTTAFTYSAGINYSGVTFGLVPLNVLSSNGAQTAQPGTVVFYAHVFTAGPAIHASKAFYASRHFSRHSARAYAPVNIDCNEQRRAEPDSAGDQRCNLSLYNQCVGCLPSSLAPWSVILQLDRAAHTRRSGSTAVDIQRLTCPQCAVDGDVHRQGKPLNA